MLIQNVYNGRWINIKTISVVGYASPEGEEDKNNTLSNDRAEAGKKAAMEVAKKAKNDKAQTEVYSLYLIQFISVFVGFSLIEL